MKIIFSGFIIILSSALCAIKSQSVDEYQKAIAFSDSEAAVIGRDRIAPTLYDHYGDPGLMKRYIISVPKFNV